MNIEAQFDLLKKKISEAYDWRDPATDGLPELVQSSLDSSENLLLQARHASSTRKPDEAKHFLKMAEMRYSLAQLHFRGAPKKGKKLPSLLSQHRIGALSNNILTFKSKVEWKNTELTMAHRHLFNEIVALFEDALNKLRDGLIDDAERIAGGAWLYHYHLCCLLNDEPADPRTSQDARSKLFGLLTKNKMPPPTTGIKNLSSQMLQLRGRFEQLQVQSSALSAQWEDFENSLDYLINEAIAAFVEADEKAMSTAIYKTQEQIVLMERFLRDLRSAPESAQAGAYSDRSEASKGLVTRRQFFAYSDVLRNGLDKRISVAEHLPERIVNLRRLYDQALRNYEQHLSYECEFLANEGWQELQSIKLVAKQALLFGKD